MFGRPGNRPYFAVEKVADNTGGPLDTDRVPFGEVTGDVRVRLPIHLSVPPMQEAGDSVATGRHVLGEVDLRRPLLILWPQQKMVGDVGTWFDLVPDFPATVLLGHRPVRHATDLPFVAVTSAVQTQHTVVDGNHRRMPLAVLVAIGSAGVGRPVLAELAAVEIIDEHRLPDVVDRGRRRHTADCRTMLTVQISPRSVVSAASAARGQDQRGGEGGDTHPVQPSASCFHHAISTSR